jgi:hypothetical protein
LNTYRRQQAIDCGFNVFQLYPTEFNREDAAFGGKRMVRDGG